MLDDNSVAIIGSEVNSTVTFHSNDDVASFSDDYTALTVLTFLGGSQVEDVVTSQFDE